jgi:hypothetical protein
MTMIDTLKVQKRLTAAGIQPKMAEAITESLAEQEGQLLTKDHFEARSTVVDAAFRSIDARFISIDARFAAIEGRILMLQWGLGIAIAGLLAANSGIIAILLKLPR